MLPRSEVSERTATMPGANVGTAIGTASPPCDLDDSYKRSAYTGVYATVLVLGLLGNGLAIYAFTCGRRRARQGGEAGKGAGRRATASTVFMLNLAASDLLFVLTLPLRIHYNVQGGVWVFGDILCRFVSYAFYVNLYCSILLLTALSVTRFISIVIPSRSSSRHTRKVRAVRASACVWTFVAMVSTPFLAKGEVETDGRTTCFELNEEQGLALLTAMNYVSLVLGFLLPFLIIAGCYVCVLWTLLKMDKNTKASSRRVRARSATTIMVVLLVFLLCFAPYHVQRTALLHSRSREAGAAPRVPPPPPPPSATPVPTSVPPGLESRSVLLPSTPPSLSTPLASPLLSRRQPPPTTTNATAAASSCARLRRLKLSAVVSHCLAVLNSCLDPLVYFFAGDHFRRRVRALLRAWLPGGGARIPGAGSASSRFFSAQRGGGAGRMSRAGSGTGGDAGEDYDYESGAGATVVSSRGSDGGGAAGAGGGAGGGGWCCGRFGGGAGCGRRRKRDGGGGGGNGEGGGLDTGGGGGGCRGGEGGCGGGCSEDRSGAGGGGQGQADGMQERLEEVEVLEMVDVEQLQDVRAAEGKDGGNSGGGGGGGGETDATYAVMDQTRGTTPVSVPVPGTTGNGRRTEAGAGGRKETRGGTRTEQARGRESGVGTTEVGAGLGAGNGSGNAGGTGGTVGATEEAVTTGPENTTQLRKLITECGIINMSRAAAVAAATTVVVALNE